MARRLGGVLASASAGAPTPPRMRRWVVRLRSARPLRPVPRPPRRAPAPAADGPSLLHADLWSGNVPPTADGEPALVDPVSYYGQREVDLAMSELFGGFGAGYAGRSLGVLRQI